MPITRRDFLKAAGGLTITAALSAALGQRGANIDSIHAAVAAFDAHQTATAASATTLAVERIVPSVCLLCPSGCGLWARVVDGRLVKLEGSPLHPINLGTLCPKGQSGPELLYNPDRIQGPLRRVGARGEGNWEAISWESALSLVAHRLSTLRESGHPERLAFLYGETRGQMRDLITHFTQAIGSPNAISHDSLNIEAAKLAHLLTQGIYDLLAYDMENANYVVSFGSSFLEASRVPQRFISGYAFIRRGRPQRGKIVVVDPRQGITGAKADEWIPIRPGTDAALALGMANVIISAGLVDREFVEGYSFGYEDWDDEQGVRHKGFKSLVLEQYTPSAVAEITGVPADIIARVAGEFATNRPAVALVPAKGGLLNGSANGLFTAMAIHALNALVGSVEAPGGVLVQHYPSCPGWPELPPDPVAARGRQAERVDGAGTQFPLARHAYQAVADRILAGHPVEVLMLYDANPMYECPNGPGRWAKAFEQVDTIVSFSSFLDETTQYADLVLPDHTFLERWQDDFMEGLGYPGVALRQPVVEPVYDTRNAGDVLIELAQRVGGWVATAFPWPDFVSLLKEQLQDVGVGWDTLTELGLWVQPPYNFANRGSDPWISDVIGRDRQLAPRDGHFDFFSRELYCLLRDRQEADLQRLGIQARGDELFLPHYEPVSFPDDEHEYPLLLNVITLMSLGAHSANANLPTLQEISGMTVGETWDSWLEMNPEAAHERHLEDKDRVWVESAHGKVQTKVRLVPGLRPDVVNLPYNQGHRAVGRWAQNRGVNGLELLGPASEPLTGLAAFTNTRVKVYRA
ncbi:MAG: molybdopterin-dependent oxidoreductase [Caldilineaceae bacterium]|nr:molybdopterin-dependent oxidoreductase [Caldilineaceae bacterium]